MLNEIFLALTLVIDFSFLVMFISMNLPLPAPQIRRLPKVSVIIAAKDEPLLGRTLRTLRKVKYPKLEIIVVANGKETIAAARKYADRVLIDKGKGKGPALNAAVRTASSKILYFLDADSVVGKNTIAEVCSALDSCDAAAGYNIPENSSGLISRVARLYTCLTNKIQVGIYNAIGTTYASGRNFAIYRKTLRSAGMFRNALTEDLEMSLRLFVKKKKVRFVPARCTEQVPAKFSWYVKQQQRWNNGAGSAVVEWEKKFHHHDIILMSFLLLIALMPALSLIFALLGVFSGYYMLLSVPLFGILVALSALPLLDKSDAVMFPFTFIAFVFVQTFTIFYSALKKPKSWYKTPKKLT